MNIIQFTCSDPLKAAELKTVMTFLVNEFSRLRALAEDPEYVTSPFSIDGWFQHLTNPDLYWTSWDAVYSNLGKGGQNIVDVMLPTFFLGKSVVDGHPNTKLEIVEVADPVASGYLASE